MLNWNWNSDSQGIGEIAKKKYDLYGRVKSESFWITGLGEHSGTYAFLRAQVPAQLNLTVFVDKKKNGNIQEEKRERE